MFVADGNIVSSFASIMTDLYFKGGKSILKALESSGEPWRPEMASYDNASELGVYEMWQIHRERTELAAMYLRRWNACEGLDVVLGLRIHDLRFLSVSDTSLS
jgi:hypothetical protein